MTKSLVVRTAQMMSQPFPHLFIWTDDGAFMFPTDDTNTSFRQLRNACGGNTDRLNGATITFAFEEGKADEVGFAQVVAVVLSPVPVPPAGRAMFF